MNNVVQKKFQETEKGSYIPLLFQHHIKHKTMSTFVYYLEEVQYSVNCDHTSWNQVKEKVFEEMKVQIPLGILPSPNKR